MVLLGTCCRRLLRLRCPTSSGSSSDGSCPAVDLGGRTHTTLPVRCGRDRPSIRSAAPAAVDFFDLLRRLTFGSHRLICTSSSCHISVSSQRSFLTTDSMPAVSSLASSSSSSIIYSSSSYSTSAPTPSPPFGVSLDVSFPPMPSFSSFNVKPVMKSAIVASFPPCCFLSSPPCTSSSSPSPDGGHSSTNTISPSRARFLPLSSPTMTSAVSDPLSHVTNDVPFLEGMTRSLPRTIVGSFSAYRRMHDGRAWCRSYWTFLVRDLFLLPPPCRSCLSFDRWTPPLSLPLFRDLSSDRRSSPSRPFDASSRRSPSSPSRPPRSGLRPPSVRDDPPLPLPLLARRRAAEGGRVVASWPLRGFPPPLPGAPPPAAPLPDDPLPGRRFRFDPAAASPFLRFVSMPPSSASAFLRLFFPPPPTPLRFRAVEPPPPFGPLLRELL
mmetsp:Transcript_21786/g.52678  ORF Transcript_21786/g.52678 Transcript_21786/m.52678 type:complete len:438 (-) Transcript_21786:47-1360(-)